jgi:large subunit ribosomal protein L16
MLFPKKVKYRRSQVGRKHPDVLASHNATRGTELQFGTHGVKATTQARVTSRQIEAARKVVSRTVGKTGQYWIRIFPDRPITKKPAEVAMGKGKGALDGYCVEVEPGRIIFEVDNVPAAVAREALRKAGAKLPVKVKIVDKETII